MEFFAGWRSDRAMMHRRVTRAVTHPAYSYADGMDQSRMRFDLALVELQYPLEVSAKTVIQGPPGNRVSVPSAKSDSEETRFGRWTREVNESDGGLEFEFSYAGSRERFEPTLYGDFVAFQRRAIGAVETAGKLE